MIDLRSQTPKGRRARESILVAAEALLVERGFHGASMRDVAGAANLPLATVVYHFARKEQLYAAVLEAIGTELTERLDALDRLLGTTDDRKTAGQRVEAFARLLVGWMRERPGRVQLLLRELLDNPLRVLRATRLPLAPFLERATAIVAAGQHHRWLDPQPPELAVLHLVGALSYVVAARPTVDRIVGRVRARELAATYEVEAIALARRVLAFAGARAVKHDLQVQLAKRVLAHVAQRTTDSDGIPTELPVSAYVDDARYRRERQTLFGELPLPIGHVSQIPNPGDFFTHDATGTPLLVTRGDDGRVRALINVCRHRGTRVASECGSAKSFVCPYHAWTYGRDGALLGIPHERGFVAAGALDKSKRGLAELPIAEVAGMLFLRPVDEWLGALADDLAGFGLATSHVYRPQRQERRLSWKLAIDVFLETYHLRPTHRDSIYPMFFDNLGLVDRVGPHLRNVFPKRSIRELAGIPERDWQLRKHANVLFHLFPNTLVLVEPDHAAVLHLWPTGPATCLLTSYMLLPEAPTTDRARAYWDANDTILMNAVGEDFAMGESIQAGLASGANREVIFGAFEHALAHFHAQIAIRTSAGSADSVRVSR